MKRIIISFLFLAIASSATMAQERHVFVGPYNGKEIKIEAFHSKPKDDVRMVEYGSIRLEKLDSTLENLKAKYYNVVKERDRLKKEKKGGDTTLVRKLRDAERRIDSINTEVNLLKETINIHLLSIASLQDSLKMSHDTASGLRRKLEQYRRDLTLYKQKLDTCESFVVPRNSNFISAEVFLGLSHLYNDLTNQSFWSRTPKGTQKCHISTTLFFSKSSPWALKLGFGMSRYQSQISCNEFKDSLFNLQDVDGDIYNSRYEFNNVSEKVSLTYLDLPIMIHIGNTYDGYGLQAWAEFGFTLGLNVSKVFYGSGTYNAELYYPNWNVTINDVPELGAVSNAVLYSSDITLDVRKMVVWANAAIGMYIPIKKQIGINLGARVDYSLTPLTINEKYDGRYHIGTANILSGYDTRSISCGVNLGLSIKF